MLFFSVLWLCMVELPFWLHDFRARTALIYSFFISCSVMFIVHYIALVNFGWYVNLGPPSAGYNRPGDVPKFGTKG